MKLKGLPEINASPFFIKPTCLKDATPGTNSRVG